MKSIRICALLAASATVVASSSAFAEDSQVLQRLDNLESRISTLETDVKTRDAKIQELETQVKERDAKIQSLQNGQSAAAISAAQIQPAAGQPAAAPPIDQQRLDNLERTVRQLNEITNAQGEELAKPKGPKVTTNGGLKVESEDGQFSFQPIGRLHVDGAWYDQDQTHMGDNIQVRRARLGMTGKMFGDFMYKVEADFAPNTGTSNNQFGSSGSGSVSMKEMWIRYIGLPDTEFTVGNVAVPFGLENYTSDNFFTFLEEALPSNTFAPQRLLGATATYTQPNWSLASGVYGKSVDSATNFTTTGAGATTDGDEQFVFTARGTFDPISEKSKDNNVTDQTELVHLGLGFFYDAPSDETVDFGTRPESNVTLAKFLNTQTKISNLNPGALDDVQHFYEINPEVALIYGPASLQGEYYYVPVSQGQPGNCPRATGVVGGTSAGAITCPNVTLSGYYAQASYFLTGESRNYNPAIARFDRVTPRNNVGHGGGWGAFELTARISNLNFDDGAQFQKGEETDYTLGLNWYLNPNIRLMANYIWVQNNASALGDCSNSLNATTATCTNATLSKAGYDDPRIFTVRAQVDW